MFKIVYLHIYIHETLRLRIACSSTTPCITLCDVAPKPNSLNIYTNNFLHFLLIWITGSRLDAQAIFLDYELAMHGIELMKTF